MNTQLEMVLICQYCEKKKLPFSTKENISLSECMCVFQLLR